MYVPIDPLIDAGTRHSLTYNLVIGNAIMFLWNVWKWEKRKRSDHLRDVASKRRDIYVTDLEKRMNVLEQILGINRHFMFPLKTREISGYKFGQLTWYTKHHLGVDYKAVYDPLYAPFDGQIIYQGYGYQGGNMIYFRPTGKNIIMRFLHLKTFAFPWSKGHNISVLKGEQIGVTGNSGYLTTGPHLHLDINTNPSAILTGNLDFSNFTDPEAFVWSDPVIVPIEVPKVYEPFNVDLNYLSNKIYDGQGKLIGEAPLPEVQRIQSFLIDKKFMTREDLDWGGQVGAGSGWYGRKTSTAVDAFQKANGITALDSSFGWWYPKTRGAANKQLTI